MSKSKVVDVWFDFAGNECFRRPNGTVSCRTVNNEPSLTIQSEKDSCDVNLIFAKFQRSGLMSNVRTDTPQYGDFSNAVDYHDTLIRVQEAEDLFMTLPATIRARFSNDPGQLIDFLGKSENRSEAISLGLIASPQASEVPLGVSIPPSEGGSDSSPTS